MFTKRRGFFAALALSAMITVIFASQYAEATRGGEGGRGDGPVVFVRTQNLYYDSIVTADPLPPVGPFQVLEMGANGLETDFGPGDRGYYGGRWVLDMGGGQLKYFSCPLLGPGRDTP